MAETGPSEGFLSRIFSSFSKKKEPTDIHLPSESDRSDPYLKKNPNKKKKNILQEYSDTYNPFKRVSDAMTPKKDRD